MKGCNHDPRTRRMMQKHPEKFARDFREIETFRCFLANVAAGRKERMLRKRFWRAYLGLPEE